MQRTLRAFSTIRAADTYLKATKQRTFTQFKNTAAERTSPKKSINLFNFQGLANLETGCRKRPQEHLVDDRHRYLSAEEYLRDDANMLISDLSSNRILSRS